MPSAKVLKSTQYIELGSYQYWPVLIPRGIRLYTYDQVPGFLRENPYITDGYRAYLTSRLCIKRWVTLCSTVNEVSYCVCLHKLSLILICIYFSWQSVYPFQWDCEYLEPSARILLVLLTGLVWHGVCAAYDRSLPRGLCHLLYRPLLLPGGCLSHPQHMNYCYNYSTLLTFLQLHKRGVYIMHAGYYSVRTSIDKRAKWYKIDETEGCSAALQNIKEDEKLHRMTSSMLSEPFRIAPLIWIRSDMWL